jgi:phenylalanine-4-hydroxylase
MRTLYKIDSFQETYFVIRDFKQLFDDTAPDFTPLYQRIKQQDVLPANSLLDGEVELLPSATTLAVS